MKKTTACVILTLALILSLTFPALAAPADETGGVKATDGYTMEFLQDGSLKLIWDDCYAVIDQVVRVTVATVGSSTNYFIWLPRNGANVTITFTSANGIWNLTPDGDEWWREDIAQPDDEYWEEFDWGKSYALYTDDIGMVIGEDGGFYADGKFFEPLLEEISESNTVSIAIRGRSDRASIFDIILRDNVNGNYFQYSILYTMLWENPTSWAREKVNAALGAGLVPPGLQYNYTLAATRAEFAALAVRLYENLKGEITEDMYSSFTFTDTTDINVRKAAAIEVVKGVSEDRFAPNEPLTREQAATMLSRLADALGKPLETQPATFSDSALLSSWAIEAVGQMQATGIMEGVGDNTFAPKRDYTREQSIMT
ncbi:MAG: S-layer homology domain-containing protein, partial [Oscillospiraceae bacterium]|nr:S-layer homology domain-containing protein [Oscillospiraceae bacterium]